MKKLILFLLILFCSLRNISLAQNPGDLDNSFGFGGQVTMSITPWPLAPWGDVAVQPDGKIVVVSNIVARFNADGSLDGSFGVGGVDTIKIGDSIYLCNAIGIQPDGKILVTGAVPDYGNSDLEDFLLIRYNSDGSRDSSFDGDGVVQTDLNSGSNDHGYVLAIQTDGKIIVAGVSGTLLALSRYHSDGSLDSTFDQDGKLVVNTINGATYMKLQNDGKILVGNQSAIARLNSDGSMDNSFGTNGMVVGSSSKSDLAVQPDGKIALALDGFAVVRLDTNGSMDNNFGNAGMATISWPNCGSNTYLAATSIALQPDGRVLVGGYSSCGWLSPDRAFILVRFNPDGSLDSSFNSGGVVSTSFSQLNASSYASAITPDLKIVLAGYSYDWDYGCLARFHLGWLLDVNTVTGTNENLVIAPNPTPDWINIEASKIENGLWHLDVRDITGRSLLREDIVATGGAIQKKVSLNDLPAGLYLLQLDNGKNKKLSKVVKYDE